MSTQDSESMPYAFHMARVIVVALVEWHVPLTCGVVKGTLLGRAALAAAEDHAVEAFLRAS